ncbi:GntR family transcriptional regulator [Neobacillus sp. PS3-34]|nr:GntR family transcriptional regulator [Neobacillus sp. PS3-34]WML50649.1 GntR family transcriptional regulator [Neobacillus sp. PS3-34]
MITANSLKSGDKIPSERELSERLNVGRSSVREALRALELLASLKQGAGKEHLSVIFVGIILSSFLAPLSWRMKRQKGTSSKQNIILKWTVSAWPLKE